MRKKQTKRITAVFLAIVLCVSVIVPFTVMAADDALISTPTAPLKSITATTGYKLSPDFSENTRVYTLFKTGGDDLPSEDGTTTLEHVVSYATYDGSTATGTYIERLNLYEITSTKGSDVTKYYVSYGGTQPTGSAEPIATINLLKVLQTEFEVGTNEYNELKLKLDSLDFTFKLTRKEILENSTPAGYTEGVPLPDTTISTDVNDTDGLFEVIDEDNTDDFVTMVFSQWDDADIKLVTEAPLANEEELKNRPYIDGFFKIKYSAVGQYKYILEEVIPEDDDDKITGVTYDEDKYEIIVSVVNADPQNPSSDNLIIGWIEVNKIISGYDGIDDTDYVTEKSNFGTEGEPGIVDGEKYDNDTTAVTYPFVNVLATDNLHITKTVTGDLGDKDQEFLFKITITGNQLADEYTIGYAKPEGAEASSLQPPITTETAEEGNTSTRIAYFSLKNGENATIYGLPVGATYTVEEMIAADGDKTVPNIGEAANYNTTVTYDSAVTGTATKSVEQSVIASKTLGDPAATNPSETNPKILDIPAGDGFNKFNAVDYVNDKPLTPPTGAFVDMIPYIAIVLVAVAGFSAFVIVRKRKAAYED